MKSLFTLLVAVVIALTFSVAGFAATEKSVATDHTTTMNKELVYTGKVVSVNDTDHTMVIKGKGGEKTFDVSNVNEKVVPGHDVSVTYRNENGKMVASSVSGVKAGERTSMNYDKNYKNAKMKTYNGKVVSFDQATHKMIVKGMIRKETFDVSHAAINGVVKPGEKVRVSYYKENGNLVASSVVNGTVKAAKTEGTRTTMKHETYQSKRQGA